MTEIKLTKRYPQSRTEDIVDAYMRGWNDALDAVQNEKFIINDDRKTEPKTEKCDRPQMDCENCWKQLHCRIKDEPQTELKGSKRLVKGSEEESEMERLERIDNEIEDAWARIRELTDEPQTCSVNGRPYTDCCNCEYFRCTADEPQTNKEIAKAIVHKMIEDAVIAEDAYPDLRQKMHDAVDEYEPQERSAE